MAFCFKADAAKGCVKNAAIGDKYLTEREASNKNIAKSANILLFYS